MRGSTYCGLPSATARTKVFDGSSYPGAGSNLPNVPQSISRKRRS